MSKECRESFALTPGFASASMQAGMCHIQRDVTIKIMKCR